MSPQRILVLGGGFAGLWAAVGAARKLDQLGVGSNDVAITLVNRDPFHCIRVRNYEADLRPVRVRLDDVRKPLASSESKEKWLISTFKGKRCA